MSRRLVIDDGHSQRELLLIGTMVVGRDPACEISHGDPRLSRRHAEFRIGPEGVTVHDLQSRNGIRVNGTPVAEAVLKPGDRVQVAHLTLRFVDDDLPVSGQHRVAVDGRSGTVQVAGGFEDDRTRVARTSASGAVARAALTEPIVLPPGLVDDRTRVAPGPTAAAPATPYQPDVAARPREVTDVGDLTIRGRTVGAASPTPRHDLTFSDLARRSWGRHVLVQGVLLALVVFLVTAIPVLAWHARVVGDAWRTALGMLAPPLVAAGFAGLVVATLIARTAARGLEQERGDRARR